MLMVLSSMSPLFILWAIRGNKLISDRYFLAFCLLMAIAPNGFLWLRVRTAMRLQERRELVVGAAEDHRDHLLAYLFATLLPFYAPEIASWRDLFATVVAVGFVIFLFWYLDLHYTNLLFAALGYRVFAVYSPIDNNPLTGRGSQVLITRRRTLSQNDKVMGYRLSDTVYLEISE